MKERLSLAFEKLENAISRMREALADPELETKELLQDGAIQRFEFTFELFWKTAKKVLAEQGIVTSGPRETLIEAFGLGFVGHDKIWIEMMAQRNIMSHVYDGAQALALVKELPDFFKVIEKDFELMKSKAG